MLLWATGFPVIDRLLHDWDPLLLVLIRLGLAGVVLALFQPLMRTAYNWRTLPWRQVLWIGGAGLGGSALCLVWSQKYADPVTIAVLATTIPLVSAIMGALAGEERLSPRLLLAIACAMAGGMLTSLDFSGQTVGFRGGEVLALLSVVLWTWYSRASVAQLDQMPAYPKAVVTLLAGALVLLPLVLGGAMSGALALRYALTPYHLGLLAWMAIASVGLSMVFWLAGAKHLGVTIASMHQNAVPFYVLLFALLAGASVQAAQVLGALLVVCGAVLAQLPSR
ncbi:MAG: hypothetical protein ETSY1_17645 [Candidatus Entotheonella factor]|uniref:EamA domain-containing protein n=2 Tax=Candidatus Entotheonella TaxID=93171 RepID=W4LLB9_ENTF1|nr:MAG: hypothetical protein ETSY1_17645 [Candidatus Entotheonella factor]